MFTRRAMSRGPLRTQALHCGLDQRFRGGIQLEGQADCVRIDVADHDRQWRPDAIKIERAASPAGNAGTP